MRTKSRFPIVVVLFAVVAMAVLGWQRQVGKELRDEIAWQRGQVLQLARLSENNKRLVAAQPTAEELGKLLAERTAIRHLREELESVRRRADEAKRIAVAESAKAAPSMKGSTMDYRLWKDAGQTTPDAAFETVLWASAGGDIAALAELLVLDTEARSKATAIFEQLPEPMRKELATPERLIALLTAKDVPLGSAIILNILPNPTGATVAAQIFATEGSPKVSLFHLRAAGDKWRLVVPPTAVEKYAAWLRAPCVATGRTK